MMRQAVNRSTIAGMAFWLLAGCGAYESAKDGFEDDEGSDGVAIVPESASSPPPEPPPIAPTPIATAASEPPAAPTTAPVAPTAVPAPSGAAVPADFAGVTWLHADVSRWAETARLEVWVADGYLHLEYDKARVWPSRDGLNANPWIFVFQDGRWYAATFEWLRGGQTSKPVHVVAGDHIKKPPLQSFHPRSGEVYGFMVSGLARDETRNVQERSEVVMLRWP